MKGKEDNFGYFIKNHKEIASAYEDFGKLLHTKGGPLDEKTRWLIKVAVSTTSGHELALRTHIEKALKVGCTIEEIEHSVLLTATTTGFPTMMTALMILREFIPEE